MTPEISSRQGGKPSNGAPIAALAPAAEIEAVVYCHSYPLRQCRFHVVDPMTLALSCRLGQLPRHGYLELGFELPVDGEIRRYREPVYLLEQNAKGALVRFSFEPDGTLLEALQQQTESVNRPATEAAIGMLG